MMNEDHNGGTPYYGTGQNHPDAGQFEGGEYFNDNAPMVGEHHVIGARPKNFPPCRPIFHHDIKNDIAPENRMFVKRSYFGWYMHCWCMAFSLICVLGGAIKGQSLAAFFYGLIILVLGVPCSFLCYWFLYSAARKRSAMYYVYWFITFSIQMGLEIFWLLGIPGWGSAGIINMIDAFERSTVLGIFYTVAVFSWTITLGYNIMLFNYGRKEFIQAGGSKQATREFGKAGGQLAYENRDTIKTVAADNKEFIAEVAYDNREFIAEVAVDSMVANNAAQQSAPPRIPPPSQAPSADTNRPVTSNNVFMESSDAVADNIFDNPPPR